MKEYFFLFGTAAVKAYNEGEAKQVLEGYESGEFDYGTYKWDDKSTPHQLLMAYSGWGDYAGITEEDYKLLK